MRYIDSIIHVEIYTCISLLPIVILAMANIILQKRFYLVHMYQPSSTTDKSQHKIQAQQEPGGRNKAKAMEEQGLLTCSSWLIYPASLYNPEPPAQGGVIIHNGLSPPTSTIDQDNALTDL